MALRLRDVVLKLDEPEIRLGEKIVLLLGCGAEEILEWKIIRKGIDARRKSDILIVYSVILNVENEEVFLQKYAHIPKLESVPEQEPFHLLIAKQSLHVVVAGMGPAGLFCALTLAEAGAQVTLLERGKPVEQRHKDVSLFWATGVLDPSSNVQFGEGGAGTFSDGKLTTRLNHPGISRVLAKLVEFGAPEDILFQAKPHIGSDRLRKLLICFRNRLISLGVDIRFSSLLTGFEESRKRITAAIVNDHERIDCQALVLAPGHSARDTYAMLADSQVLLERKPFAIGVRVEHPAELINRIQYGQSRHPQLPAADYRLSWKDPDTGRGVYSFCMCPGGRVINASSEVGGLVVNGMSDFRRDAPMSNSALVVTVTPEDFCGSGVLAGVEFQRHWERAAWQAGQHGWRAPAQPLLEFLCGRGGKLLSSCQPEVIHANLDECLPSYVASGLRGALPYFERKMRGFVSTEATLIGVETRTSAPLRILRNQQSESVSHQGLYPAGEGAGYAGGIMSAALDGLNVASNILLKANQEMRPR